MRIAIPTTGSRGDVQPYVALGAGLKARGHEVCLATHSNFEKLVRSHGLDFYPLEKDGQALQASDIGDRMLQSGGNGLAFLREFTRLRRPLLHDLVHNCWRACQGADVILVSSSEFLLADAVAEKERLPVVWTSVMPLAPTRHRESCLFPAWPRWLPGTSVYNLLTHGLTGWGMWLLLRSAMNRARREVLGLRPVPLYGPVASFIAPRLCLDGYSAFVAPAPTDWGAGHHITGYWFLEADPAWQPSQALSDFLAAGRPPICIGFGSMHDRDASRVTDVIMNALERSGQRGVLISGWGGLEKKTASDRVLVLKEAPHSWLFPRMAAVVHHGGAGTTAAALRAGVPSLVVPFMADQPFWGRRVHALGVGPKPIFHHRLDVDNLTSSIRQMFDDHEMRQRVADLGERIRAEDGIGRAVDLLEQFAENGLNRGPRQSLRAAVVSSLRDSFAPGPVH